MKTPETAREALHALGVMSGALSHCAKHDVYFKGPEGPQVAVQYYYRHIEKVRRFFGNPAAFDTALKYQRTLYRDRFCVECTRHVGFV